MYRVPNSLGGSIGVARRALHHAAAVVRMCISWLATCQWNNLARLLLA